MENYSVEEWIGRGSYGSVARIRRKSDNQRMVWKEVNYGRMSDAEKRMICSEVNCLRELRHPFIVRYFDRIIEKQTTKLFIVMEYCSGGDLGGLITRHKKAGRALDESYLWQLLGQLILGLQVCHNGSRRASNSTATSSRSSPSSILHRDIKPANILLDEQGNAKLGDFGMAKQLSTSAGKLAQTNVGTPMYMSPELINEETYDERSDIWALGCVLYEAAAMVPPFTASNQVSLALKINAGKFSRIPSRYSDELFNVISWMLQHDRRKRPRTDDLIRTATPSFQAALTKVERQVLQYDRMVFEHRLQVRQSELAAKEAELAARERDLEAKAAAMSGSEQAQSHQLEQRRAWLDDREAAVLRRERALKRKSGAGDNDFNKENPGSASAAGGSSSSKRPKTIQSTQHHHQQQPPQRWAAMVAPHGSRAAR